MPASARPTVAVIGATGAVGASFLRVAEERELPVGELRLLASARSAGRRLRFRGEDHEVRETSEETLAGADLVFCSANSDVSRRWGPVVAAGGGVFIDDGSAFRMEPGVPLVVPEVNGSDVEWHEGILSIPNCTTTPLVLALHAMRRVAPLERVSAATYQAVTGVGAAAAEELRAQLRAIASGDEPAPPRELPHQIALNVIPQVDDFAEEGYTREELKMQNESRKILHQPDLRFSATCVRVPTMVGHAEAVHVEFASAAPLEALRRELAAQPGLELQDEPGAGLYPTPLSTENDDRVFVGRLRRDPSVEHGAVFWVVSDNLRKGAATNAIQIAEEVLARGRLGARRAAPAL
ncbi:MAG: aspartate-semialdehyde dehydrogenase [Chloroflexi bacterium]|nr:aspartate-semialdehyde dehydrogenase [Chloroflexota bacterium]